MINQRQSTYPSRKPVQTNQATSYCALKRDRFAALVRQLNPFAMWF